MIAPLPARPALFAVAGRPVLHSHSPALHGAAFEATGRPGLYLRLAASSAEGALRTARELGLSGLNVTAPFKEDFAARVDELDPAARRVGAVNTVLLDADGRSHGFNTDVAGVGLALRANGVDPAGASVLVLGAGGAARAAAVAMIEAGARVVVASRHLPRAEALAASLGCEAVALQSRALVEVAGAAGIVIGCAATAEQILPSGVLAPGTAVLEANYAQETALVRAALSARCMLIDGREWLLYQGARAFELFTGARPPVGAMRQALYVATPRPRDRVTLVGFMGAGKTSVARQLERRLGWGVEELDTRIERGAGVPIPELFRRRGEAGFRQLESAALREALEQPARVLSCGGGAVLDGDNVRRLRERSQVVWLWAGIETLLDRLPADDSRPLLAGADRVSAARALLSDRVPAYAAASDLVIDTTGLTPDQVAEVIEDELHPTRPR